VGGVGTSLLSPLVGRAEVWLLVRMRDWHCTSVMSHVDV